MVVGEAKPVGRGELGEIRIRIVVEPVLGALESGLKKAPISEPGGAAMSSDLIGMDGENVYESKPTGFDHLASSRMALRYFFAPSA